MSDKKDLVKLLTAITCDTSKPSQYWILCKDVLHYEFLDIPKSESILTFIENWRTHNLTEDWRKRNLPDSEIPKIKYENDIEEKLMHYTLATRMTLSTTLAMIPTTEQPPPAEEEQSDDFITHNTILSGHDFGVQMIQNILDQDGKSIESHNMTFSKECHYVLQQLSTKCAGCKRAFRMWYSKIQHVSSAHKEACHTYGANNIEKKLTNEMYRMCQDFPLINKRTYRVHSVLEEIIESNQKKNRPYRSDVIGLPLNVPMPPPEYFRSVNWDEYHIDEVEQAD